MSTSKVGNAQVYEAGDQRNAPVTDQDKAERFHEGQPNSHKQLDRKDAQTHANKLNHETKHNDDEDDSLETQRLKKDPTLPARAHGNEPSRGAQVDAQIRAEEEEELRNKGKI